MGSDDPLFFSVLGPLRVEYPGGEIRVGGTRRRGVLLRLLASANRAVPLEVLAEEVWEGDPPSALASTLQSHVSALRQLLGVGRLSFAEGGYRVNVEPGELDASLFESELADGRAAIAAGSFEAGLKALEAGLGRWRGQAFADVAGAGWTLIPAARLAEERNLAIEDGLEARLALGLHHEVCGLAEAAVAEEPFRERRWAALMLALYRAGRQAEALRCYQRAREKLGEELGIDPSPQLARMEHDVLVQSPALDRIGEVTAEEEGPVGVSTHDSPHTNLPAPVSGFIGRTPELTELDKLMSAHRLVTIVGAGGIGKTRLAIEAAGRRVAQTRDGVWFVDLTSVSDPSGLAGAVAGALGVRSTSDEPLEAVLQERARHLDALVVVDNCEHLVAEVAALVEGLLEAGPGLRALTTSRELLGVPGERVWHAPPIATPRDPDELDALSLAEFDAVRLFVERAAPPPAGGEWGLRDLRLIGALTAKLDGLPLAIELAASRSAALGLRQLAVLDDRLGLLGRGSRTAHSRHQTLEATIDWSYQLLPGGLRTALRRLSVFVGGFSMDAASAVLPTAEPVEETLAGLVERSLLSVDEPTATSPAVSQPVRYRMLETIREFAARQLRNQDGMAGEAQALDAHSRHFAELAARAAGFLAGWHQGQWLTTLEFDYGNLRAAIAYLLEADSRVLDALRMVVHLDRFWHNRGHLADCAALLRHALDAAGEDVDTHLRCAALNLAAQATIPRDPAVALESLSTCLPLARAGGDDYQAALALNGLGQVGFVMSDRTSGLAAGRESLEVARRVGDPLLLGQCLVGYGLHFNDDLAGLKSVLEEAIGVTRRSGDRVLLGSAYNNLGNGLMIHGAMSQAREYCELARSIHAEIGVPDPTCSVNLGWIYLNEGHHHRAADSFSQALAVARRYHLPHQGAWAVLGLACLAAGDRDHERAAALVGFADAELDACGQTWTDPERSYRTDALADISRNLGIAAEAHYDSGRTSDRNEMIAAALELALDAGTESLAGNRGLADAERMLVTILFADIVGSTEQLAAVGDKRWRAVLDKFEQTAAHEIAGAGGRMVKSTGDGLLATFDTPARAVRCGFALHQVAASVRSELRVGLHTGEIERRGDDVAGIAVHIAARILSLAGTGEVLVSRTVRDLVAGSGLTLTERGAHHLKGIPDDWQIFSAHP
jgi:predicted ATPase/DNA-binding SARP family transcriptional activator/class 3 adenylate cyclase